MLREEQIGIREEQRMLREEQPKFREDLNKMLDVVYGMDTRLTRVEHTLRNLPSMLKMRPDRS